MPGPAIPVARGATNGVMDVFVIGSGAALSPIISLCVAALGMV